MPAAKLPKLSTKQQTFVERYLVSFNGAEAARLAGYSPKTARFQAAALLTTPNIKKAIAARIAELKATTDEVWLRLTAMARSDMGDFVDSMGTPDWVTIRGNGASRLVKKVRTRTTRISESDGREVETHDLELELYDAQAATVQLAKLLNMYPSVKVEVFDWRAEAKKAGIEPDGLVSSFEHKLLGEPVEVDDTGNADA